MKIIGKNLTIFLIFLDNYWFTGNLSIINGSGYEKDQYRGFGRVDSAWLCGLYAKTECESSRIYADLSGRTSRAVYELDGSMAIFVRSKQRSVLPVLLFGEKDIGLEHVSAHDRF